MPSQAPATKLEKNIDIGGSILYIAANAKTSLANAKAATDWKKFGLLKSGSRLVGSTSVQDFKSGTPRRLQKRFYTEQTLEVSGDLLETGDILSMAHVLGKQISDITFTLKASSPSPTTVVTGSTQSAIIVTDATGFEADKLIKVGNQYGYIKSINTGTDTLTMADGLSGGADPTTGDAVSEVATVDMSWGDVSAPADVSLKIAKVHTGNGDFHDIYIYKAQANGSFSLDHPDGDATQDGVAAPFSFEAVGDPDVEGGSLFNFAMVQN